MNNFFSNFISGRPVSRRLLQLRSNLIFKFIILFFLAAFSITALVSCHETEKKRPFGLVRLGRIEDLKRPESFLSSEALLLRYDSKGFSVMSLLCTYDLAPLKVEQKADSQILKSPYTESSYNLDGTVASGPTTHALPYYELVAASGEYGGPVDSLFAKVGTIKPANWRLNIQ